MREISDRTTSGRNGESQSEVGSASDDVDRDKKLIRKANQLVRLDKIFSNYASLPKSRGLDWSEAMTCPLPHHKGGKERTPSFYCNFSQNRFHCQGCGSSGQTVQFIAFMEGAAFINIANRLLKEFSWYDDGQEEIIDDNGNYELIDKVLFAFGDYIRDLFRKNKKNSKNLVEIEKLSAAFDQFLVKRAPNNKLKLDQLEGAIESLKRKFKRYE